MLLSCVFCLCTRPLLFFSSSRLVCEASVFESLVLLQASRAGWPSFSILSLLSRCFFSASAFAVLVSGTSPSSIGQPPPQLSLQQSLVPLAWISIYFASHFCILF
ncbi:hypothetical protein HDV62DRAFT_300888 [Trichoderma sp. SZMC 28011]